MTPDELTRDRIERVLIALPRHQPRPESIARLRTHCRRRLGKQLRSRPFLAPVLMHRGRVLAETALAGALGLIYLADVIRRALSLSGF